MSEPAKNGAMLNIKIAGEISISGVNIGDGYDYTNGGAFMTVVYEVKRRRLNITKLSLGSCLQSKRQ